MDTRKLRKRERGIALILVLVALLVVSAIGLGMMFMTNTETSINANYKDTQSAFFAMHGGLEEMRDRMRQESLMPDGTTSASITLPTAMPGSANSIYYITNPAGASDTVDPKSGTNTYRDDEFCHEAFSGVTLTNPGATIPCDSSNVPPSGSVAPYISSFLSTSNTAAALSYKWVRLTLKQNGTFPSAVVDSSQPASSQVCWSGIANQEIAVTSLGYSSCSAAQSGGSSVAPVYIATALALTPKGSRRMGQYETAAFSVSAPPTALGMDGPAAIFNPRPSSNNYFASGVDTGAAGYSATGGTGSCTPSGPATVPAISTGDAAGQTLITTALTTNPDRSANYTGCTNASCSTTGAPSIVNAGSGGSNQLSGAWSSPAQLNAMVASLANAADTTYTCGIGAPCNGSGPYGTNATPLITYVNGDFNFGATSGAGILVVTGTLNITGNSSFNGLVLVIGQGLLVENGSGTGSFNGSVFLARTNAATTPYAQLATLGTPVLSWNGGGNNGIQYNSCWANIGNKLHYMVVASREEMY